MGNKLKRFLLCFLAVSMMSVSANTYADDEEVSDIELTESSEEDSDEEVSAEKQPKVKIKETEEKVRADVQNIVKYLQFIGNINGYDIYYKEKKFDDAIWEAQGGKPKKKKDYTDEQKELDDILDELDKLGELTAINSETGEAVATFDDSTKCDEGLRYVSDAGRYLLTVDKDSKEPLELMEIVSSIDNPYLFKSSDGKAMILTDEKYNPVREYFGGGIYGDKMVYFANDKDENVIWLTPDGKQVLTAFRYGPSNDKYRMLIDDTYGTFGIENLETNYIWWSSPIGATRDRIATPLLVNELRSSNILRYGIPEKRSNNSVLRSGTDDCKMTITDLENGIRIEYNYEKAGFKFPVEYTLEDDHLKASLKVSEIEESNPSNIVTEMTVLNSFGAAPETEDGYFVIPDGSGALVRFNNEKTMDTNAYTQRVYGNDITAVPTSKGSVTEQIYLPVYGIVKEDNAMLVIASKGDSNAYLSAQVSKQSNSTYNLCSFTFMLRGTDTFYMSGNTSDKLTVFESGGIKSDDIELLYYPISKEGASYVDVAECYRNYLMNEAGVEVRAKADSAPMYIDLYGGTEKKKPVLGVPVTMKQSVTKYDEAVEIIKSLKQNGVDDMIVSYNNWTNDGIQNKIDTGAKSSGTLGSKRDFNDLKNFLDSGNSALYPVSDNRDFYSGNGYYSFSSTAVRVSGSYSRIISYDRAYGIPDGFKANMSLLSPSLFGEVFSEVASNYSDAGIKGVSIGNLTTSLYGDYGKKNISRFNAMNILTENYKKLDESLENGMLADSANAYALPYVSHITNVPLSSSRFDLFNEDIPFYQLVMHGVIPYSTTAINGDADSETLLLMATATGSNLDYDMLYEETSILKDTEYDIYYYANYANWIETAAAEYKLIQPILSNVSDSTITGYDVENDGKLVTTTYSNGTVVKVDFERKSIDFNGNKINLSDYDDEGGVQF